MVTPDSHEPLTLRRMREMTAGVPRRPRKTVRIVALSILLGAFLLAGLNVTLWVASRYSEEKRLDGEVTMMARGLNTRIVFNEVRGATRALGISNLRIRAVARGELPPDYASVLITLERLRLHYDAAIVYVMNAAGDVVASTRYGDNQSLTGKNYAFRPYFREAMQGRDVVYPAVGVTTNERGFYYAAPVICPPEEDCEDRLVGAVVMKTGMAEIDRWLAGFAEPVVLISPEGVVFASNESTWVFGAAYPLDDQAREKLRQGDQFRAAFVDGPQALPLDLSARETDLDDRHFAVDRRRLELHDDRGSWQLAVLRDTAAWYSPWLFALANILLLLPVVFGTVSILARRRAHHAQLDQRYLIEQAAINYRAIFDAAGEVVAVHDIDTMSILDVNEKVKTMFGYDPDDVVAGKVSLLADHHDPRYLHAELRDRFARAAQEGKHSFEWLAKRRDGQAFWAEVTLHRANINGVNRILAVIRDITARKESADRLHRLGLALNQSIDGIAIADLTGVIVYTNEAWARMHGRPFDPAGHYAIRDFHTEEQFLREVVPFNETVLETGANSGEVGHCRADGSTFPTWMTTTMLNDESGNPVGLVGIARDISAQKRAEIELRQAKEAAEAADRAKSDFLANMSHEIRTPLNGIIGMLHVLRDSGLGGQQTMYTDVAFRSAETLLNIINDILDFSRIAAGKMTIETRAFNLHHVLREVLELLNATAAEKGIELTVLYPEDAPRWVVSDPLRVRQVLTNLVGNAVKFTARGHVRVVVAVPERTDDTALFRLSIQDTGIGIAPENLERIFEKFSQVEPSGAGGTGLGLPISRRLVEMMGGTLTARSRPGEGSTFTFTLPLALAAQPPEPVEPEAAVLAAAPLPAHVLLVEDDDVNRLVAQKMLEIIGCSVQYVANGYDAVAAAERSTFDIIFMDARMPGMDGFTAAREIRARERGDRVPIIAMTAYALQGAREECLAAGMDDYISKPLQPADLREIVARWYRR